MSSNTGGDTQVPEGDLKKLSTEFWQDKGLYFSFKISSQQASIFIIPSLVVARSLYELTFSNIFLLASMS